MKLPVKRTFKFDLKNDSYVTLQRPWWLFFKVPEYYPVWSSAVEWLTRQANQLHVTAILIEVSTRPMLRSTQFQRTRLRPGTEFPNAHYSWVAGETSMTLCEGDLIELFGFSPSYLWMRVRPAATRRLWNA